MLRLEKLNCFADLHLHLDGAISLRSARMLAERQKIALPESDAELLALLRVPDGCTDLNMFLSCFDFPCSLLQTAEGIRLAVANLLDELAEQGVMYAELRFAPQKSTDCGLTQEEAVQAALAGIHGIPAKLILCCMRGEDNRAENEETIRLAAKYLGKGVAAADLAGAEALFPTRDFADLFALARELGVPFTIHAGEADGAESVRTALAFGASRIGHGVRAEEDPALVKELAERQIPLEMCPTSNLDTATVHDLRDWPLRRYLEVGVPVTINTDDPGIVGTTLREEYRKLISAFDLRDAEVRMLLENGVRASFAEETKKTELLGKIAASCSD